MWNSNFYRIGQMRSTSAILSFLLFVTCASVSAKRPSEATIQLLRDNLQSLSSDAIPVEIESRLTDIFRGVTVSDGLNGVVWLGLAEPVVLEVLVSPDSVGLHAVSIALLKQASNEAEISEMVNALVMAQISSGQDPFSETHLEWIKEGCLASELSLEESQIDQILAQSLVLAMEDGEDDVSSATFRRYKRQSYNNYHTCREVVKKVSHHCFIRTWDNCVSKHKPDYHYKNSNHYSYSYNNKSSSYNHSYRSWK